MKHGKFIIFASLLITILYPCLTVLHAGPFVHIDSINSTDNYPEIKLILSIKNPDDKIESSSFVENNIQLFEDGNRVDHAQIKKIYDKEKIIYFLFVFDISKGNRKKENILIKSAAKEIVRNAGFNDKFAIYTLNQELKQVKAFTSNKKEIIRSIDHIAFSHGTHLFFNAIYDSIDLMNSVKETNKAVVVFSNNKDAGSNMSEEDIIGYSKELKVPVFFFGSNKSISDKRIVKIAKFTGGWTFCSSTEASLLYEKITSYLMGGKYQIQYKTELIQDNKTHTLEVKVRFNGMRDRDSISFLLERALQLFNYDFIIIGLLCTLVVLTSCILIIIIFKKNSHHKTEAPITNNRYEKIITREIELEETERAQEQQTLLSKDPDYNYANAWIIEKEGPECGSKFSIHWKECTIGRNKDNSIVISDDAVSPYHVKIREARNKFYIYDLVSENGTYLNGKKLLRPKVLNDWDEIQLGRTVFIFRGSKKSI